MVSDKDIENIKKPDLWSEHHKAMRENPQYLIDGLMDCYREEQSFYMPYKKEVQPHIENAQLEPQWTRRQWDRVQQLEAMVVHYQKKVEELLKGRKPNAKYKTYDK